jgi:hypothetical protein
MASSHQRPSSRIDESDTLWAQRSPSTRHAICLGLLLIVAASFYAPSVFEGKSISGSDTINFQAISEVVDTYEERTGERPLWAPNAFAGMPYINYGIVVPQADDLISQLRGPLWPVGHLFLLMVGVYFLLFYLTRDHFAGLLSGVAFGFTTYIPIILMVGHNTKFIALAYAPYLLLAFVYTLRNPSLLGGLLFAAVLALELRARHPQVTYDLGLLMALWWLVEGVGAVRDERTLPFAKSTGWLALGTVFGLFMAAQPYLTTYQYKQFSVRGTAVAAGNGGGGGGTALDWTKAMRWSHSPGELFTFIVAEAFGGGGRTYWGPKAFTEGPHYLGGAVIALVGLALWQVRTWLVWGLGTGVLATVLFSLGKHAAWINWPMFQYFPLFDAFRAPAVWLALSALGLAVLAGIGLDYALRREPSQKKRRGQGSDPRTRPILVSFGVVFGIVAIVWLAPNLFLDFEKPNEEQRIRQALLRQNPNVSPQNPQVERAVRKQMQKQKEERRAAFATDAQRTLLFLALVGGALVLYRRRTLPAWATGFAIVAVVTVDLWGVDARYLSDDVFSSGQGGTEQAIETYQFDRFIKKKKEEVGGIGRFRVLSLVEGNPSNTARPSYHYESLGGYHGAKLQRYQDYLDHILQADGSGPPNENALDLMNTRYIVARQQLPGTEVVYRSQQSGVLVLKNLDAVPRGFLVGQTEVVESAEQTWARLRDSTFNPRRTALLPEPLDAPVTPVDSASTAEARLTQYMPEEIKWTVQTGAPRLLVASEVYYPAGWNAYVDGEQVPIHRVNYLLRGVHVPAGEHEVVLRFEPKAHTAGVWIAGVSTALVYGGILTILGRGYIRRRSGSEDASGDGEE